MIRRLMMNAIELALYKGKAIIVTGPRQVGKTTLLREIARQAQQAVLWLNCDEPDDRADLDNVSSTQLRALVGASKLVVIDEAQRVPSIGLTLKLLVDQLPDVQVIATGSSALELSGGIKESLTGRKFDYRLLPFSTAELAAETSVREEGRLLERRLIYGFYPDVVLNPADSDRRLAELADSYLYKDILKLQDIRKPMVLQKLLLALALRVGSEVSNYELGQTVGTDPATVDRYIGLLEQVFVVFQVHALSRNLRNELKKSRKVFFYDNGIRNAIIKNFNPLDLRADTGALWENFMISERIKANLNAGRKPNYYFWRTTQQQEIDWLEEEQGKLTAFEFKWNVRAKARFPATFQQAYPGTDMNVVSPDNYMAFLLPN
ncbi:ATP-binding protein [Spirosoma rhododendri]|uniref:ATP-binding protein n=1 Tax=Spirosoma rhododendri TaxID=2728024 RepID=A0A7L5DIM0_9BACT|nr:ATP-binding protein [Spirosoma rhododendri]QJD77252.1 ATP-binding protein [Spirosoma rhododendri]